MKKFFKVSFIRMYQHKNNTEYVTLKEIWPGALTELTGSRLENHTAADKKRLKLVLL
jgi:hypothetical protein